MPCRDGHRTALSNRSLMDRNDPSPDRSDGPAILRVLRRVPTWAWALPCGAIAVVYAAVWPSSEASRVGAGARFLLLRWGHAVAWLLFACSFVARSRRTRSSRRIATALVIVGLVTYVAFVAMIA